MTRSVYKQHLYHAGIAVAFSLMLLIVSPLTVYLANNDEFAIGFLSHVQILVPLFIALSIVLFVLESLLARLRVGRTFDAVILALAVAFWVQSQLFNWNFGLLDGRGTDWASWNAIASVEIVVWAALIAVSVWLAHKKPWLLKNIPIAMIALGLASVLVTWLSYPYHEKHFARNDSYFQFSPTKNKLIIILDTFQSDIFAHINKKRPEETAFLSGFTFYPNTLGAYPTTIAAVPTILAGQYYTNKVPIRDWVKEHNNTNIGRYFVSRGYDASYATWNPFTVHGSAGSISDLKTLSSVHGLIQIAVNVIDAGVFSAIPTFLKPYYYHGGGWFLSRLLYQSGKSDPPGAHGVDSQFVRAFSQSAHVVDSIKPQFKFFHFAGAHPPVVLNAYHQLAQTDKGLGYRGRRLGQARGVLFLLDNFLQTLKDIGVYKAAEIIVVGDHGGATPATDWTDPPETSLLDMSELGSARPLFLYKPSGSFGHLEVSGEPQSLAGIPCILSDGNYKGGKLCNSEGSRVFYLYDWSRKYWDWSESYVPPMVKYVVRGDVRDADSWTNTLIQYSKSGVKKLNPPNAYTLGNKVSFARGENSKDFTASGWSGQEENIIWTVGSRAAVSFHLSSAAKSNLVLQVSFGPYVNADLPKQVISVFVNDTQVSEWVAKKGGVYSATIPESVISGRDVNVNFRISNPSAPCDYSESRDCRMLGMAVRWVKLKSASDE